MSVDYYIACHECRKIIHVAQDGLGGFSFYSGEPDCMKKLRDMLAECSLHCERLAFVKEQGAEWETYRKVEWAATPPAP